MKFSNLIQKRKLNKKLSSKEIQYIVKNYSEDKIKDQEMIKLIDIFLHTSMSKKETINFFNAAYEQAKKINLNMIKNFKIDKHSTGGIGDKITLLLIPILDALEVKMFKFSGRRLGFTGGTIEKLSVFPNIDLKKSINDFQNAAKNNNVVISENNAEISNFEKKLYLLRSQTKKTNVLGMIVNSIMIKKITLENNGLIINVNVGNGAFLKTLKEGLKFINLAAEIAKKYQRKITFIITRMDEPLGLNIGNKLEILEVINYLKNPKNSSLDLNKIIKTHIHEILLMSQKSKSFAESESKITKVINSGLALKKLRLFVEKNQGNFDHVYQNQEMKTKNQISILSYKKGYFYLKNASKIGFLVNDINVFEKKIDHEAGIQLWKKNGDWVKKGELIAKIYTNHQNIKTIEKKFLENIQINSKAKVKKEKIIKIIRRF